MTFFHRVVQGCPIEKENFSFRNLQRPSRILAENISETVRDRVISSEFLAHRVLQGCPIEKRKIPFFPQLMAAILDFSGK